MRNTMRFRYVLLVVMLALVGQAEQHSKSEIVKHIHHFEMVRDSAEHTIKQLKSQLEESS